MNIFVHLHTLTTVSVQCTTACILPLSETFCDFEDIFLTQIGQEPILFCWADKAAEGKPIYGQFSW